MNALDWLRPLALGACGAALLGLAVAAPRIPALRRSHERHVARLERDLRFLQAPLTGRALVRLQAQVGAALVACAALLGSAWPLVACACVCTAPAAILQRRRLARTTAIELQLDRWLVSLAHGLRANPALGEAVASSAEIVAEPLASELVLVRKESALGVSLDRALDAMSERVSSPVVTTALATLRIARSAGGDVAHTLETSAATLREMARLEGTVRTKTAEGRAQAVVIAVIPFPLFVGLDAIDPNFLAPVWTTSGGHALLAAAGVLWLAAILAARRIVAVDI